MCYKSHPDLKVLEGIYRSAAYPFLFKPVLIEESGSCFVDGGFLANYPLKYALEEIEDDETTLLGIKTTFNNNNKSNFINDKSNILIYMLIIIQKTVELAINNTNISIPNEIIIENQEGVEKNSWKDIIYSEETRKKHIQQGVESSIKILSNNDIVSNNDDIVSNNNDIVSNNGDMVSDKNIFTID